LFTVAIAHCTTVDVDIVNYLNHFVNNVKVEIPIRCT